MIWVVSVPAEYVASEYFDMVQYGLPVSGSMLTNNNIAAGDGLFIFKAQLKHSIAFCCL